MFSALLVAALAVSSVFGDVYYGQQQGLYNPNPAPYQNTLQIRTDSPYPNQQINSYAGQNYQGQPLMGATVAGPQVRTDIGYSTPNAPMYQNPFIQAGGPQYRSDVNTQQYTNTQYNQQPYVQQQSQYVPYMGNPQARNDLPYPAPQSQSYSAQYNVQPQNIYGPQVRSDVAYPVQDRPMPYNAPYTPYQESRALIFNDGHCCETETNYCGGHLAATMRRENCAGFVPREGVLYSCQGFQPKEILGCKQCLVNGPFVNDVCIPADSWNKKLIDIGGWMRVQNSTELRCCSEDVQYCGAVLYNEVSGGLCQIPIKQEAFYGCRNGQPFELAPGCDQCITTGEGTNDLCINGADRFKVELDITNAVFAPENQKKPTLIA